MSKSETRKYNTLWALIPFALMVVGGESLFGQGSAWYNVKSYGATGNGTTPDTADIEAAYKAACTTGGGTVYFPPGTYYVPNGIEFGTANCNGSSTSHVIFTGDSTSSATLLGSSLNGSAVLLIQGISDVTVRNLTINGGVTSGTETGIFVNEANYVHIEDCYVHGVATGNVTVLGGSTYVWVQDNRLGATYQTNYANIQIGGASDYVTVEGNVIAESLSNQDTIDVSNDSFVTISHNIISGTYYVAIQLEATFGNVENVTVTGNTNTGTVGSGSVTGVYQNAHTLANISISGNSLTGGVVLSDNASTNVTASTVQGFQVTGNTITQAPFSCFSNQQGISGDTITGISLVGNILDHCGSNDTNGAIYLKAGGYVTVSGNTLTNPGNAGVYAVYFGNGSTPGAGVYWGENNWSVYTAGLSNEGENFFVGDLKLGAVPTGTCVSGATATNSAGASGSVLYVCEAGSWTKIG